MHPFRQAVENRDEAAIEALLAENVVFTSPVAFKPYPGKAITAAILRGVSAGLRGLHLRPRDREPGRPRPRASSSPPPSTGGRSRAATSSTSTRKGRSTTSPSWSGRSPPPRPSPPRWVPGSTRSRARHPRRPGHDRRRRRGHRAGNAGLTAATTLQRARCVPCWSSGTTSPEAAPPPSAAAVTSARSRCTSCPGSSSRAGGSPCATGAISSPGIPRMAPVIKAKAVAFCQLWALASSLRSAE